MKFYGDGLVCESMKGDRPEVPGTVMGIGCFALRLTHGKEDMLVIRAVQHNLEFAINSVCMQVRENSREGRHWTPLKQALMVTFKISGHFPNFCLKIFFFQDFSFQLLSGHAAFFSPAP